jgi:hypothetical protein
VLLLLLRSEGSGESTDGREDSCDCSDACSGAHISPCATRGSVNLAYATRGSIDRPAPYVALDECGLLRRSRRRLRLPRTGCPIGSH